MNEQKTEIKKLVITINGADVSVPIEDAKKLYDALGELFGKKESTVTYPIYLGEPYYRWRPYYVNDFKTYCKSETMDHNSTQTNCDTLKLL